MNRDEIFKMARKSGVTSNCDYPDDWLFDDEQLERFFHMAQAAERKECAKVCDELAARDKLSNYYAIAANAIRARGQV